MFLFIIHIHLYQCKAKKKCFILIKLHILDYFYIIFDHIIHFISIKINLKKYFLLFLFILNLLYVLVFLLVFKFKYFLNKK